MRLGAQEEHSDLGGVPAEAGITELRRCGWEARDRGIQPAQEKDPWAAIWGGSGVLGWQESEIPMGLADWNMGLPRSLLHLN